MDECIVQLLDFDQFVVSCSIWLRWAVAYLLMCVCRGRLARPSQKLALHDGDIML